MKQLSLLSKTFALIVAIAAMALPARADRTVNQLQFGKQTIEVAADEVITFYDMNGYQGISSSSSNNSQSLTVFKPAEGMAIQLIFEDLQILNDGPNWPAYVNVYAGDPDPDGTFSYATSTSGVTASSTLPAGNVLEKLDGTYSNLTYTATDATGIISIGYLYKYAKACRGWKATVKCITLEDMTVTGASSNYEDVDANTTATEAINFATAEVTTTGVMNADKVTGITFKATTNEDAIDPMQLRLYAGSQPSFKGDTPLEATVVANRDGYTFTLNQPLTEGTNKFSIAGEYLGDAVPGAKAAIEITKIATAGMPDGVTPFTAGTPVAVAKPAIALISTSPQVITVGDVPYNFYDDGGKDGNITQGFEGQITFVPATEGYAIKIDFSKLDLFNTSTVGYNDVFKFYNGREVNEANLITTLLDEPEIVKSTADDGSITVYLKSTAGYPKSGWEALVSQFLPGDMTLASVTGEAASTATVSAGESNAQMLVIDVLTDNTANPLSLKGINLTAADVKNIARARAYYLGKKNEFTTTNPIGEVEVGGTSIAIAANKELIEGHNYLAVVLDLNDNAQNGEEITLSLDNVLVGETTQAPEAAVTATRTVNNVCHATQGSHSHVISGPWTFTNTEGYNGKYEAADADYIVTFTPAEAGYMAEIDFSDFHVYYASSSYSTRAIFEIYSGTEVNSANLLWNLKDNSEQDVGPGHKIRSTAADGSLTIRFNPKTTSSYYTLAGWTATVTPFKNHNMEIKDVTVNQTSTAELATGAANAQLIDFVVNTEGTLTTKVINKINLDLKGSEASISKVNVLYNNTNDYATAIAFGSVENPAQSEVEITGEQALAEAANYFWVTVDVKADAEAEAQVDAKLLSLTDADGNVTTVENGDPEGVRVVKYIYLLEAGDNVVVVTSPLMFYDDGGADGNVSKGLKGNVIFVPGRENCSIEINTMEDSFSIGSGKMFVYSGSEAIQDNILGNVTGYSTTNGPANLISKAEDGTMLVTYEGNTTATTLAGWAIEVKLHEKTPFVVEDITATATTTDVMRNSQDNVMQQLKLEVSGDKDPITISSLKFTTAGTTSMTDIAAAKLYYTKHSNIFSNENLIATTTASDGENVITLDEPLTITENGDYYLWLTYDIAEEAQVGNTVAAQALSLNNGEDLAITGDAASRNIKGGLKGNYIIGASDNATYHSFAEAITALQAGVEGAVTFQVEDGTYAENIWFASIPGASEQNTITFTSLNGNRGNVIVAGSGSSEYMPGSSSYKKGVVFIENTPYVTLEKMSFIPAKESEYSYVVQIFDRSRHFTLRDCHVKATPVNSGYSGIYLVKTSAGSEDKTNNDYATFENNLLEGGYMGFALGGTNYVALTREKGLVVRGNTVNEGSKGIYVYDEDDMVIENNTIYQSSLQKTGYWGLDLARVRGNVVIAGNKVTSATSYYSGGIQLRMESYGTAEQPILVYNNVVNITNSPSASSAGIEIDGDNSYISLYNNTVRMAGNGGYCYYTATRNPRNYAGMLLQNNLFQNLTSSNVMFIHANFNGMAKFVNNAFYGETILTDTDIEALNALDGNSGNIVEQAEFMSESDLHLLSAGNLNMGLPVDFITTDADGKQRNDENPTVGAYEFAEVVAEKPEIAEGYPTVNDITETTATVKSKWTVGGKLYYMVETVGDEPTGAPMLKSVTADQLKETEGVDIMPDTEVNTNLTDLTPNTTYKAYLMVVSPLGEESDVVETEEFTTLRHIEPLTATLNKVAATINAGETATITPVVAGGDEPYTYEWRDQMNEVVGNEATLNVAPEYSYGYRLTVTSADGQTVTAKTGVRVLGEAVTATMDDNYLDDESHWAYDPTTASMVEDGFYSGSYYFNNGAMPSYNYWYGYSLSNETATNYASLNDQWHSAVGEGHNGSSNFSIAFPEGQFIEITNSADGENLKGVYVSNNAYAYNGMAVGDGFATAFSQGSWFKLTAVGFDVDDEETARTDFYLADYRSDNALDHYILDTWQWMDLRPLGKVAKVRFLLDGSDKGQYGLNTAAYFALDDFNCERDIVAEESRTYKVGNWNLDLSELFTLDEDGSTVIYTLEDLGEAAPVNGAPALLDIESEGIDMAVDSDGMLNINAKTDKSSRAVIIGATQKGKTQYIKLSIYVDNATGIEGIIVENGKTVERRQYVNVAGQVSDRPFRGVNIIVTRYTDGTTRSAKVVF